MNTVLLINNTVAQTDKPDLVTKMYLWSLITEPLLYFIIASGGQATGIPLSLSRLLQIGVLLIIVSKIIGSKVPIIKHRIATLSVNKFLLIHILILLVSTLLGLFLFGSYNINIREGLIKTEENVPFLKSKYMRPVFDIFLLMYYYFYFVMLAPYFLKTKSTINYFFKLFIRVLYFVLIAGFIDLLYVLLRGEALIKRHFGESTDVGFRFHSIAGEPRDAFVYLVYSMSMIFVSVYLFPSLRNKRLLLILLIVAIVLTQSASGMLGILIGGLLTLGYFLLKKSVRAFYFLFIFLFITAIVIYLVSLSPRMQLYIEGFSGLYDELKSGGELPYILLVQSVNFLPFWGMYNYLLELNFYQFLFGSGFSSVAYYNMNFIGDYSYSNPNSQLTRLIFDGGIVGFIYYLLFLVTIPIKFFTKQFHKINYSGLIFFFILTGAGLSHRSLIPFIFLGVISAVLHVYGNDLKGIEQKTKQI